MYCTLLGCTALPSLQHSNVDGTFQDGCAISGDTFRCTSQAIPLVIHLVSFSLCFWVSFLSLFLISSSFSLLSLSPCRPFFFSLFSFSGKAAHSVAKIAYMCGSCGAWVVISRCEIQRVALRYFFFILRFVVLFFADAGKRKDRICIREGMALL